MAIVTLLNIPEEPDARKAWDFEHSQLHRQQQVFETQTQQSAAVIPSLEARIAALEALSKARGVRVSTVSTALNSSVINGGALLFDNVGVDTDGFAPIIRPFSRLTVPTGLAGAYIITALASGSGTQATSMGVGLYLNGAQVFGETNQTITGPTSVNYTLDNIAVQILTLADGDQLQLINNSISGGPNDFTSTFLAMARIGL